MEDFSQRPDATAKHNSTANNYLNDRDRSNFPIVQKKDKTANKEKQKEKEKEKASYLLIKKLPNRIRKSERTYQTEPRTNQRGK